jgi:myxalamid-type polyketide synthase MxaE and MxaD
MRDILFAPVNFSECQKVLDFGCGYGSDLITLGQKYPHLILNGYTLSSEQAKVARKKVAKADLENQITIFNRDSAQDVFPVKYDVVFGFEVAHHIKDKGALFSNIGEHLNDQGFLVLADFISNQSFAIEHEPTSSYFITSDEWNDLLKQHHLKLIDVIDISQEIANFLNDENFEKNLEDISKINQDENVREAFQSYNQLGKLLRKRLASTPNWK